MKLKILTVARNELEEASDHYESERPGLGREFVEAFDEALDRIQSFPNSWSKLDDDCRRCRFHKFPYGIVYRVHEETIFVLAVMHLYRRPGYWKNRLKEA